MLDEIIKNGAISDTSLRMLVKKIIITERKGKLKIKIQLNADFSTHIDFLHDEDDTMYKSHGDILVVEKYHSVLFCYYVYYNKKFDICL